MKITFLFAFILFLAVSKAQYKPKLEVYQIRLNDDDEVNIDHLSNSNEKADSIIPKLFKIKKEKQQKPSVDRVKSEKVLNVIDGILNKLKPLKGSAKNNQPHVYVISDTTISEEDDNEHKIDENASVPININLKDVYEILGQQPHRYKRPVLRIQDRTAPPRHRYVYDSDSY
ncbi:uncharacterized protein LOC115454930 isoform X2 [Manduca sexta]|uniref:uncharacterized protein LOC115454930 isoform X2 n=1 Tax=Manduca sexta TaxID=7130 RepID=UPI0018904484|nr:uncharacterized protein LOC115454930 isoform X2 [Manduca sexta]